jgi:hypothetical protein
VLRQCLEVPQLFECQVSHSFRLSERSVKTT